MKKQFGDYYVGLDIGTESVGWAVTDLNYRILKFNGKDMWGIRLFEEAQTAKDRRAHRTARRNISRRRQRISLLQELLGEEIEKVDPTFYLRLKESQFYLEDKKEGANVPSLLFHDEDYKDKDYHKQYPTIYHLRYALMTSKQKMDIRLYYLAIAHIVKHRGHFLIDGDFKGAVSFDLVYDAFQTYMKEEHDRDYVLSDRDKFKELLCDVKLGKSDKKKAIEKFLPGKDAMSKNIHLALSGSKFTLSKMFDDEDLEESEVNKISFSEGIDDEKVDKLENDLGDRVEVINKLQAIYNWSVLQKILQGSSSISEAQIRTFEKHGKDLKLLKDVIKQYLPKEFKNVFYNNDLKTNYPAYSGHAVKNGRRAPSQSKCTQEDFGKYIKTVIKKITESDERIDYINAEIDSNNFMPKQVSKSNSVIPHQLHEKELKLILENLKRDYPVFDEKLSDDWSICEKILQIFTFRIPYYIGPLNNYHSDKGGNSWVIRKPGKIYPWNFNDIVDRETTAERFIRRMTNKCTYLVGEDVVAKNSLMYSRYQLLNELNNLTINDFRISVELKQKIYKEVFERKAISGKVTLKNLKKWLVRENEIEAADMLGGVDDSFKSDLSSYHDFKRIFGDKVESNKEMIEDIINAIVLFGDAKDVLIGKLENQYKNQLTKDQITAICRLKYKDWGRFSKTLLQDIKSVDAETGEVFSILDAMWETNYNFMELMSENFDFRSEIQAFNDRQMGDNVNLSYNLVKDSYASPAVKRQTWQALQIVNEIKKITGHDPKRIFVETTRRHEEKKRTQSRKEKLLDLYKNIKDDRDWYTEINSREEREFLSKKLYLYYTQMGKDMYSGEEISLDDLFTGDKYDIDHIYPQSITTDNSIHNNLVLVNRTANGVKDNNYPLNPDIQRRMAKTWKYLLEKELITKEKYSRLIRKHGFTEDELASFISRQLVETSQATKLTIQVLGSVCKDSTIVYSKANAVSKFRQDNNFIKVRSINDLHHAKDAYLNVVVGNVYYVKFTKSPLNYIKNVQRKSHEQYSLNRMFDFDVVRNNDVAWKAGKKGSINIVKKYMKKNSILFTRMATEKHGEISNQMLVKKGKGQLQKKTSDPRMSIEKYGGYNKPSIDYYVLVQSEKKGSLIRTIEGIPVYLSDQSQDKIIEYLEDKDKLGLVNPAIIYDKIKINTCLKIDGYPMHLSGKTNQQLIMKNAVQLVVDKETAACLKKAEKVNNRIVNNKDYKIEKSDEISKEDNIKAYDCLMNKAKKTIYKNRPSNQISTLEKGKDKFEALTLEEQCTVLMEILKYFSCKAITCNFSSVGGGAHAGKTLISKNITNCSTISIINQSITGLFEEVIDLKAI